MDIKNNAIARRLAINANNTQKNDIDVTKDALVSGVLLFTSSQPKAEIGKTRGLKKTGVAHVMLA